MLHLRPSMTNVFGVLALSALLVPPTVMAGAQSGASIRAQVLRNAAPPVGGAVSRQELPGCANPSEPFAGPSQGCAGSTAQVGLGKTPLERVDIDSFARGPRQTTSLDGTFARGPRQTTSLDGTFARGPRQTTSLDGSINPETGSLSIARGSVRALWGLGGNINLVRQRGPELNPEPTYDSTLASTAGVMGYGWSFPYSMSLHVYRGVATVTQENGSQVVFKLGADHRFHAAPRVIASLAQVSGSYILTRGSSRDTCPSYLLGSCEAFTFNHGHLSSVKSPGPCKSTEVCGNGVTDIHRDGAGRAVSATTDSGDAVRFRYTAGHITSITGPGGISEHFTYDSGNLSSATDPNGNTTHYTYDLKHRLTGVADPLERTTLYDYDSSGRLRAVTDPRGNKTTYVYDRPNRTTTVTSPEGRRVVIAYQDSTVVSLRAPRPGGGPPLAEWTFAYDSRTLAVKKTVDPNLGVTTAVSDADGMPLTLTDPLGNKTTFTYSDTGRRSSVTDPMGVKTRFTYDEHGNVFTRTTPSTSFGTKQALTYSWSYDDSAHPGDMTSSTDPRGNETDYTYDSRGNPASLTDPLGNTWAYSIKKACFKSTDPRVARRSDGTTPDSTITDPLGHTTTDTCDANGNLLSTTDATGATTTNTYDAADELVSTTDPAGRKTSYSYNAAGDLIAVHQPDGTTSHATYGSDGELLTTVDPAGGTERFTYDGLGRRVTATDQLGRKSQVGLSDVGNVTSFTDAMGITATNTYDADNRLLSTDYSDGATPPVSYTYDADGRRTSMTDGTGTTTYTYDSLGQLTQTVDGSGASVISTYDLSGDRTALRYPNGHTVTMQYDGNGQMTCVTDWLGNTTQYQYNSVGRWKNIVLKRGLCGPELASWKTTKWGYDAAGRPLHITMTDASGVDYASFDYTRAADGRIIVTDSTGLPSAPKSYTYDANGRLGSENGHPVSFDSRDNVTALLDGSKLSYDAADELVSRQVGGLATQYTVNADGERTGASSAAGTLSYSWTCAGCLASFTVNGAATTYALNGDGQRIMAQAPNGTHHTLVWDFSDGAGDTVGKLKPSSDVKSGFTEGLSLLAARGIIAAKPGTGGTSTRRSRGIITNIGTGGVPPKLLTDGTYSFIYGPDGLPIEQIDNAGHALFLDEDAQGSVRLLTDVSGTVEGTASYDAFGNQTAQSGASSPFGYAGMYRDAESGLYAMSGSVYDPPTGQALVFESRVHTICRLTSKYTGWAAGGSSCGNCAQASGRYTGDSHICTAARVGDGYDEDCNGYDDLCASSPYAAGGGDPVNGLVIGNTVGASAIMTSSR